MILSVSTIALIGVIADAAPPTASRPASGSSQANDEARLEPFIADGLAWLAAHQRPDGVWDRCRFNELCPSDDRCAGQAVRNEGSQFHRSITSLAALAFLGAGFDHEKGPYARHLTRAFEFILAQQNADGSFAPDNPFEVYEHALCTLAVAEAFASTKDPVFDRPLRRAVVFLARAQQDDGGWDYLAARTHRNDAHITGWALMALRSAAAAGIDPPADTVWRAIDFLESATAPDGRVRYADEPGNTQLDRATGQRVQLYGPPTTAIGLFARSVIGLRLDDAIATQQATALLRDAPSYAVMSQRDPKGTQSEYYWLFATFALRQRGGPDGIAWNRHLRNCILEYQERPVRGDGARRHAYGSWPAYGIHWGSQWGRTGGRIYATAVNLLSLEASFKRKPAYLASPALIGPSGLQRYVRDLPPGRRAGAIARVLHFDRDTAEPVLLGLADSSDADLRLRAALALATLGSPLARDPLIAARKNANDDDRARIDKALKQLAVAASDRPFGKVLSVNAAAAMCLFDTDGRPVYYGQVVSILREGRPVASGRVDRRFTEHRAAAVTVVEGTPQPGDQVVLAPALASSSAHAAAHESEPQDDDADNAAR